jgi:phosphoribosyl 1,2-cyclic phosphodiesterase
VTSLGSGSSGNALLVRTGGATLLVDCGVGVRGMTRHFVAAGLDISQVDAVLLSHEHSDHVRELPRFNAQNTAIFSTRGTAIATRIPLNRWEAVNLRAPRTIADVEVLAIPVTHDASEPCGFLIRTRSGTVTVLTDLGCRSGPAAEAIAESDLVVLEANHDEALLRRGPYPRHLQRRILSDAGHLSNVDCAELLATALQGARRLPSIWLAHMSETNNRPHLAVKTVAQRLARSGLSAEILALPRRESSRTWRPEDPRQSRVQLTFEFE